MTRNEVGNMYTMEELVPIVYKLANELASDGHSSVPYTMARQLMETVMYTIAHAYTGDKDLVVADGLSAQEAYEIGYQNLIKQQKRVKMKYKLLLKNFDDYGSSTYASAVRRDVAKFFEHYNIKYFPIRDGVELEYQIEHGYRSSEGLDIIEEFVDAVWDEQIYLRKYPRQYVIKKLLSYDKNYGQYVDNLKVLFDMRNDCVQ